MSASDEIALRNTLSFALTRRREHATVEQQARTATIRFMREARRQHKSWAWIGRELELTDVGARRFFERNNLKTRVAA